MKKKIIIILIIVLFLILIGIVSYLVFFNKGKITVNNNAITISEKISMNTIRELAKDKSLKIVTTTEEKIPVSYIYNENNSNLDGTIKEEFQIYLELKDGKIYLTNSDYSSEITDINEKIVFMVKRTDGCMLGRGYYYILTENKNLYVLSPEMLNSEGLFDSPTAISNKILSKIKANKSQKLGLKRINGNYKVLAFTNYSLHELGGCTQYVTTVYTSDDKVRIIGDDLNTIHGKYTERIGYAKLFGYEDKTLNIVDEGKIKNSKGEDLIYKKIFTFIPTDGLVAHYVIIDENNYIYLETTKNYELSSEIENKVKLYSSTIKYVSYSNPRNKLIINLSNGKKLEFDTEDLEIK